MNRFCYDNRWLGAALVAAVLFVLWIWSGKFGPTSSGPSPASNETRGISSRYDPQLHVTGRAGASPRISLSICSVPNSDGTRRVQKLTPPATPGTIAALLAELDALPISFSPDRATSRLVTRDLVVRIDGTEATVLAANPDLAVKSRPAYARGWIVLRAVDPFAALAALPRLRATPGVASATVALARQQVPRLMPDDPLVSQQWHLKTSGTASPGTDLNIESVWNYGSPTGIRGGGIRIGIVDDGLETTHPDLVENVDSANGHDWNGNDSDPNPGQGDRHGTACAGLAAARGNNSLGVTGVAPEAALVGLRLIAAPTTDEQEAEAMLWKSDVIEVKSNSWGPPDTGKVLEGPGPLTTAALESATESGRGGLGTIFVWAAGNGNSSGDNSNYDGYANSVFTIATGAIDSTGNAAYYSEPGANLVVCAPSDGAAPAIGISTTDLAGTAGYNTATSQAGGDFTDAFGGTSAAAPLVAGVAALMLEKNPALGWRDVQEILIRSATKIRPGDSGWADNGAGLHFHHSFGAGLVNAAAAVALASAWKNLAARESVSQTAATPAVIPENDPAGVTISFHVGSANLRIEHATLTVDLSHTARGNLEIVLTSPSGTASRLAEVHSDTNDDFANWTFTTVRCWGESADGDWTLKIADRSPSGNTTGGTLHSATLQLFGTAIVPKNPPPAVAIVSPAYGAVFSPGTAVAVEVAATDLTIDGEPGHVAEVALFDNGAPVATRTAPPYSFEVHPADGTHELVARVTDDEGATADSAPVFITVANRPPAISAASLNAFGEAYANRELRVQAIIAADPDGTPVAISYRWQSSADGLTFTDAPGEISAVLAPAPARAGLLWRCWLTPADGELAGPPFLTAVVNLLARPGNSVLPGGAYSYQSGLVLAGDPATPGRSAIIHEFSQGPAFGNSEWVEILVLRGSDLGYWDLSDTTNQLVFANTGVWSAIPAGTLIVVYNGGAAKDPALPADDPDPSDRRMIVSSTDPAFFDSTFDSWIPLANGGDVISLNDAASIRVHSLSYGSSSGPGPHIPAVPSATAAYFARDTETAADDPGAWQTTSAAGTVTPGAANNSVNAAFVTALRNGAPVVPSRFSLVPGYTLPTGLALDPVSGLISGTATGPGGIFEIRLRRTNSAGGETTQGFALTIGPAGGYPAWAANLPDPPATADPDADGIPNLLEYALGSSPETPDHPIQISATPNAIVLDYTRSKLRSDVEIVPETSAVLTDSATWTETGIHLELTSETADFQHLRAILPITPAAPRRFLRLKAIQVP